MPQASDFEQAIRDNYRLWNEGEYQKLDALYRALAPRGFTMEYVGAEPFDGFTGLKHMWDNYHGQVTVHPSEVIVNGTEAAAYVVNTHHTPDGELQTPSIELYKLDDGALSVRYFHRLES